MAAAVAECRLVRDQAVTRRLRRFRHGLDVRAWFGRVRRIDPGFDAFQLGLQHHGWPHAVSAWPGVAPKSCSSSDLMCPRSLPYARYKTINSGMAMRMNSCHGIPFNPARMILRRMLTSAFLQETDTPEYGFQPPGRMGRWGARRDGNIIKPSRIIQRTRHVRVKHRS